nr:hypothetical protein [uncultured Glaciecola sp.]
MIKMRFKLKTLAVATLGAAILMAPTAHAATKLCGLLNEVGSISNGDRVTSGVIMEYNDANFTSTVFSSCKEMRDKLIKDGVPYTSQINGANPPQTHRVHMLQNDKAKSSCEPDKLMKQDDIYQVQWAQPKDGSDTCWNVVRVK